MKKPSWSKAVSVVILAAGLGACDKNPTQPTNHAPTIRSLTAFPASMDSTDSVVVVCNAADPDADTLVYDWLTDDRLSIKGARGDRALFSTYENARVFYPGPLFNDANDSAWVSCSARDQRGSSDGRRVTILLIRPGTQREARASLTRK